MSAAEAQLGLSPEFGLELDLKFADRVSSSISSFEFEFPGSNFWDRGSSTRFESRQACLNSVPWGIFWLETLSPDLNGRPSRLQGQPKGAEQSPGGRVHDPHRCFLDPPRNPDFGEMRIP